MNSRLGLIKIDDNGQKIIFLEELTAEDFGILESNIVKLHAHKSNQNLHSIFLFNFIELSDFFQKAVDNLVKERIYPLQDDSTNLNGILLHANRLFLNFLSSFRTLIDHTGTYLSRTYGNESKEHSIFLSSTSEIYDTHFEYRFLYRLRNYAQHCGLPISKMTYEHNKSRQSEAMRTGLLNVFFERDLLLENFNGWGEKVKGDLLAQPELFPAMWTVRNFYAAVETLFDLTKDIERPHLMKAVETIESICKNVPKNQGEMCVFYDFEMPDFNSYENSKFKTLTIPWYIIKEFVQVTN